MWKYLTRCLPSCRFRSGNINPLAITSPLVFQCRQHCSLLFTLRIPLVRSPGGNTSYVGAASFDNLDRRACQQINCGNKQPYVYTSGVRLSSFCITKSGSVLCSWVEWIIFIPRNHELFSVPDRHRLGRTEIGFFMVSWNQGPLCVGVRHSYEKSVACLLPALRPSRRGRRRRGRHHNADRVLTLPGIRLPTGWLIGWITDDCQRLWH